MPTDVPYLTPAELADDSTVNIDSELSDTQIAAYVSEFEQIAEEARGVAFTPRTVTAERIRVPGAAPFGFPSASVASVFTHWPMIRSIAALTIDGVPYDVSTLNIDYDTGEVWVSAGLCAGSTLLFTYDHGYDTPASISSSAAPYGPVILRACGQYVRAVSNRDLGSVGRDVIYQSEGGMATRYLQADWSKGVWTPYSEVNRLLDSIPTHRAPVSA